MSRQIRACLEIAHVNLLSPNSLPKFILLSPTPQAIAFFHDGKYTSFMSGLSLVGCARCIAMVIVWVELAKGDREYCAAIVALNSLITIFLYSPYALLFLVTLPEAMLGTSGTSTVDVTMADIAISVGIYLGIPLVAGVLCWYVLCVLQIDICVWLSLSLVA